MVGGRRYCRIIFAGCHRSPLRIARCGARSNRRPQATVRSHFSDEFLVVPSCDVTSAKLAAESDCISASGQMQIRLSNSSESSPCHGGTPVRSRCVGRCAQRAHSLRTTAASTLGMGRRIMAERRRPRTGRGRRWRARTQARNNGRADNVADSSLRAFVRALARQAARECFERELRQRSPGIQ